MPQINVSLKLGISHNPRKFMPSNINEITVLQEFIDPINI